MNALLVSNVFPPQAGGSGRWFWELYRRLPRANYQIAAGDYAGADAFDSAHDLNVTRMPLDFSSWGVVGAKNLREYGRAVKQLRKLIREQGITDLHAGCCLPEGFLAWWLGRRLKLPYLVYVHGEELEVARSSRELTWMTRRVLNGARALVVNSRNTAGLLTHQWDMPSNRVHVLHPGVDVESFQPAARDATARRTLGWDDRSVILTVGRLQKRKGHDTLIRALPRIRQSVPNVLYCIVGDGAERESLQQLVTALDLSQHVQFLGELQDAAIVPCYQQCDLFVLPNREVDGDFEGFGIVLLEAQACGRPVIAGDSGGTSETMKQGQTGHIVDCRLPDTLAERVAELLTDSALREQMGQAARVWVERRFAWEPLAVEAHALFTRLSENGCSVVSNTATSAATAEPGDA